MVETTAGGQGDPSGAPRKDWIPSRLGPNPPAAMAEIARDAYAMMIGACGASVSMFNDADGTSQRESVRRWYMLTVLSIARLIEYELSAKAGNSGCAEFPDTRIFPRFADARGVAPELDQCRNTRRRSNATGRTEVAMPTTIYPIAAATVVDLTTALALQIGATMTLQNRTVSFVYLLEIDAGTTPDVAQVSDGWAVSPLESFSIQPALNQTVWAYAQARWQPRIRAADSLMAKCRRPGCNGNIGVVLGDTICRMCGHEPEPEPGAGQTQTAQRGFDVD